MDGSHDKPGLPGNLVWVGIGCGAGLFLAIVFGYALLYPGGANALWGPCLVHWQSLLPW